MKFDLLLTDTGDLSFAENFDQINDGKLEFNFFVSQTEALCFNFDIEDAEKEIKYNDDCLTFNFYMYDLKYNKYSRTVTDDKYIQQAVKIRLDTELGTVREQSNLGSMIHDLFHSNLNRDRVIDLIKAEVARVIADILPNCSITITLTNTNYLDYHDNIQIVIKDNEKIYYYYL